MGKLSFSLNGKALQSKYSYDNVVCLFLFLL